MVQLFTKAPRKRNTFLQQAHYVPGRRKQTEDWRPLRLDGTIALISFSFVLIGLLFTYSSSAFETTQYVKRQLLFDVIGLATALFLSQTYMRLQRMKLFHPMHLMYATWALLIIVLFTREQAILMMSDAVEAASRSLPEYNEESIGALVDKIVDMQVSEGYFNQCPITLIEIQEVKEVLKSKLKTIYHTRIQYPEIKKENEGTEETS